MLEKKPHETPEPGQLIYLFGFRAPRVKVRPESNLQKIIKQLVMQV
jgi:hypothetical protein